MPNQTLAALIGSLISAAHLPHGLCLTPLYFLSGSYLRVSLCSYTGVNVICVDGAGVTVLVATAEIPVAVETWEGRNRVLHH